MKFWLDLDANEDLETFYFVSRSFCVGGLAISDNIFAFISKAIKHKNVRLFYNEFGYHAGALAWVLATKETIRYCIKNDTQFHHDIVCHAGKIPIAMFRSINAQYEQSPENIWILLDKPRYFMDVSTSPKLYSKYDFISKPSRL